MSNYTDKDVLVEWEDGTQNIVARKELVFIDKKRKLKKQVNVKMHWGAQWYKGKVVMPVIVDDSDFSSSDDISLAKIQKYETQQTVDVDKNIVEQDPHQGDGDVETEMGMDSSSESLSMYDSDIDPEFKVGICEVRRCKEDVWAACEHCEMLVCYDHCNEEITSCDQHGKNRKRQEQKKKRKEKVTDENRKDSTKSCQNTPTIPEQYIVEGIGKEVATKINPRTNKQKDAKLKRNRGQEYTSSKNKKLVSPREVKQRCAGDTCNKNGRQCAKFDDKKRHAIFEAYYELADLRLQREFLVRHVESSEAQRKTTRNRQSRRKHTMRYYFSVDGSRILVCKRFFLGTLGISERTVRTALSKITSSGMMERESRGGRRSDTIIARDTRIRQEIEQHIDRFPKVESHFCRSSSTKEYLHPDLNLPKMYGMFISERSSEPDKPSFSTYSRVFKNKNLAFHRPKKDQCSLCMAYQQGDNTTKEKLQIRFQKHQAEKKKVREIKNICKEEAMKDKTILCGTFDLQQVIYVPVSRESALFYKRRLSNYNMTFYNIGDKHCHCFTWHEGQSKRGSSEIATAVYTALQHYDEQGITTAYLFSDGCSGQNKNSIMPAMMLYLINKSSNLQEISLRFFESFHGQNEGDSVHSTISTALARAGNVYEPSQLIPIFSLARPKQPYVVRELQFDDFLDFKSLSRDLRILDARREDESGQTIHWNNIMEMKVSKQHPKTIFYKTSHNDSEYKTICLKRQQKNVKDYLVAKLNSQPINISKAKYQDLVSLCSGDTPIIRLQNHKNFFISLPHD